MKKYIIYITIILIIIISASIYHKEKNQKKFYLDNKYYSEGVFNILDEQEIQKLINDKETFILYTYNNYCTFSVSCDEIFEKVIASNKINAIKIPFEKFKKTSLYKKVKYAPSVIIVKNGKIINYLDSNDDNDLKKYQDAKEFENWLKAHIYLKKQV